MFWDINKTLSYDCLFNFIVGNRGGGKTFGCKNYVIKRYLKYGEQFVYLRRYANELRLNKDLWRDISKFYPEHELTQKGDQYSINGGVAGNGFSLSTADKYKSISYDGVTNIIFDEFIVENRRAGYLNDEVIKFFDAYETIARMRDVRVFFLANAVSVINPYFTYFDLEYPREAGFYRKGDILVERVENQEYIEAKKATRFGQITLGSEYQQYSLQNQFLMDTDSFIERKTGNLTPVANLVSVSSRYGVWRGRGLLYISDDPAPDVLDIAINPKAFNDTNLSILSPQGQNLVEHIVGNFHRGFVRFENQQCKSIFKEFYGRHLV